MYLYMCVYILTHIQKPWTPPNIYVHNFWIISVLFGQGTKAKYGRGSNELGFAAGTAILCAEIMSSNGSG